MNIIEAVREAAEGRDIRRKSQKIRLRRTAGFLQAWNLRRAYAPTLNDYLADDWEVIPPEMTFYEAMEKVMKGAKVQRLDQQRERNLYFADGKYWEGETEATFTLEDFQSSDWYVSDWSGWNNEDDDSCSDD